METMDRSSATAPNIVTAEDLLKRMRAGTKEVYEIKCRDLAIPMRILTIDELNLIRRDAIKHAAMHGGDEAEKNVQMEKTVLKMASNITPKGAPMLSDRLLGLMSVDEINHLYSEYVKIMDDVNPAIEQLNEGEFRALVEAVKKNSVSWSDLSLRQLRAIFTSYQDMIQRQATHVSHKDNSSGGQQ